MGLPYDDDHERNQLLVLPVATFWVRFFIAVLIDVSVFVKNVLASCE